MLTEQENKEILENEMESIKADILLMYNASGKKTFGEFERGLHVEYNGLTGVLKGYTYLGGRRAGKQPPLKPILAWVIAKGLARVEEKAKASSIAFLIARKIAEKGTNKENHLQVYTKVITPERIQSILDKISSLNTNAFIQEVVTTITKSFNEFQ